MVYRCRLLRRKKASGRAAIVMGVLMAAGILIMI